MLESITSRLTIMALFCVRSSTLGSQEVFSTQQAHRLKKE
jgi:hypothetical protein